MKTTFLRALAFLLAFLPSIAREGPPIVDYSPKETIVEGNQPLSTSFVLSITAPNNVVAGSSVTITPLLTLLSKPDGVSDAEALGFVSFSPASLTFTTPGQTLTVTVQANYPEGVTAGAYAYKVITNGWETGTQDGGAFINATVFPSQNATPPTVSIATPADNSSFTYQPAVGPLVIPVQFTSSAQAIAPITAIDADLNGTAITVTSVNNGDGSYTSSGNLSLTAPGTYTLRARATNTVGTGEDNAGFNVVISVQPPTVSIASPASGSGYNLPASGSVSVPYSFSAHTVYGGISTLSATLDGTPVSFTPTGLGTATASGSGSFTLSAPGTHTLVVTATDSNGGTASTSTTFTVAGAIPPPTVTISAPADGTTLTRIAGSGPTTVPFSFTGSTTAGYTITQLSGTLSGSGAVGATITGLNTASATGTGTLTLTSPGTYTLTATAGSGSSSASASVTFKLVEVQPPAPVCSVNWLPPISLGKVEKGGSNVAIKFELLCPEGYGVDVDGDGDPDCFPGQRTKTKDAIDPTLIVAVTEIFSNGSAGTPQLFPYSGSTPNAPGYTIQGNDMYHVNFPAANGTHRYRIEVYRPLPTHTEVLGSREFRTK